MATEQFIIDIRTRGTRQSSRDISRIGQSANQVRRTLAFLRNALVVVASLRVFGNLVRGIATFAQGMSTVRAVTGATEAQFKSLRDRAKELGATTRFTATEAAEGMLFLGRAGFSANEIMATIGDTLNLAQAGALDLGRAADIASNILKGFGLEVDQVTRVVDVLAFTANRSNTNVEQLGIAMKVVAPIASGLGITLEQTSAAMAVLGNAGIQASIAGTGFRRVITELESPGSRLRKILKAVNLEIKDVRPSVVGLSTALRRLRDAGIGATLASEAFGKRGGFIFATLSRDVKELDEFEKRLKKADGTAASTAKIMDENLNGALLKVKSALEAVLLAFADLGAESFLTKFFTNLATALRAVAANADVAAKVIKVLLAGFLIRRVLGFAAGFIRLALSIKAASLAAARNPFGALAIVLGTVITAGTGVTAALTAMGDQIDLAQDGSVKLKDALSGAGRALLEIVSPALNAVGLDLDNFNEFAQRVVKDVGLGFVRLSANVVGAFSAIPAVLRGLRVTLLRFLRFFVDLLNKVIKAVNFVRRQTGGKQLELFTTPQFDATIERLRKAGTDAGEAFERGFQSVGTKILEDASARRKQELNELKAQLSSLRGADTVLARRRDAPVSPGKTPEELGLDTGSKKQNEIKQLTKALRDLEGSVFPLINAQNQLAETQKIINDANAKGIKLNVDKEELLKRVRREQLGLGQTAKQAAEAQQVLNNELKKGNITLEERVRLGRQARLAFLEGQQGFEVGAERAFLKLNQAATDSAGFAEMVFTDAFDEITKQVQRFVETGKFSLNDFFRNFAAQLLKLGTQQAIAGIGSALFPQPGGQAATTGSAAGIGGLVTGALGQLGAFQSGGSFTVGPSTATAGIPGIDNRLIAFRARDGEEVSITPKGDQNGAGVTQRPVNIIQNITAQDADSFRRSSTQNLNRAVGAMARARAQR